MTSPPNFIESYIDFYAETEVPIIFSRWCCIGMLAALLGRNTWVLHGHKAIYPNMYIMLVGEAGSRKTTAIKVHTRPFIQGVGYNKLAANKTSKEKFLLDLSEGMENVTNPEDHLDIRKGKEDWGRGKTMRELFGVDKGTDPSECLIMADEFNMFMGHSNVEFIDLLTDLWDFDGVFTSRIKNGKSILVPDPTLTLLGGNTQVGISMSFPIEVIGQGFFARVIHVYSDPSGRKITFPPPPDPAKKKALLEALIRIRGLVRGAMTIEPFAMVALDEIYNSWEELGDVRLKTYSTRRFTHLLKLCVCVAAAKETRIIDRRTVEYANSILHYTEFFMPKALGEFGKSQHSDIQAKILELLEKADKPLDPIKDIWKELHRDLRSTTELATVLSSMMQARKIQSASNNKGLLPVRETPKFNYVHCNVGLLREYIEYQARQGLPI